MDFDVHTPSPDDGHEAIRVAVVKAIADLGNATADVGDTYWLTDLLFGMVDGLYTANAELADRVAVLEQWRADTAAATGDVLDVTTVSDDGEITLWTWTRTAPNGEVIATGDTYTREQDAWRGAHRANPDL